MFDPFDPNNRDRRKRRTRSQIDADEELFRNSIDIAFRSVLEGLEWPDYVQADLLIEDAAQFYDNFYTLRKNMVESMLRLGYLVHLNPGSGDGRWKALGKSITVFRRAEAPVLDRKGLRKYLDW